MESLFKISVWVSLRRRGRRSPPCGKVQVLPASLVAAITPASIVRVVDLPCTKNMSYCQANLVLARRLEPGRVYNVRLRVRDSKGDSTTVSTEVQASNFSASLDMVFPHRPNVIMVPEVSSSNRRTKYFV